jgi:glyoxylase-like metal-dependent hydrolase (beta-lactamase superfamily II)
VFLERILMTEERQDLENYPDVIKKAFRYVEPVVPKDIVDILEEGPVLPASINAVIFSHLHFDHVGDCTKFPDAEMIAGPGSRAASFPGWPAATGSPFLGSVLEHPRYHELNFETDIWIPFRPFTRAHDFFGDGSLFLIDTPGHMAGHLGAMALTARDEWVFMGGDCCHHRSLLVGSRPMSVTVGPAGTTCFHKDPTTAKETIEKIRMLEKRGNVLVALAHDAYLKGRMPEYPESLNGWMGSKWKENLDTELRSDYQIP